jgi:exodeoxyribonuclease V alpha subunit
MAKVVTLSVMLKQLILVGDPQQLPPISWGRLMQPLLEVEQIPRCHLLDNHRTSNEADGQNTLIEQANRLVADTSMKYRLTPGGNFFWFDGGVAEIKKLLESLAAEGYSGWECTVIVPYRKLAVELNEICQDLFNGANVNQRVHDGIRWRVGDRIMLLKNIKSLDVMNGEEGEIVAITDEGLMIKFTDDELLFKWSGSSGTDEGIEDDEFVATTPTTKLLQHSWALTCHKAQGSEWPIVIGYVPWASNFITRRLMYVMMTRAMKWFFLFGDQYTISQSINNVPPFGNCALAEQLEQPPAYGDVGDAGDTLNNFILQPRDTDMVNSTPE